MEDSALEKARWHRAQPRQNLPAAMLQRMVAAAFPRSRVLAVQPLAGGLRNANLKLQFDSPAEPVVLRVYEHDPSLCRKELDLFRALNGVVPVPQILHAEPDGMEDLPPFTLARYIDAITFLDLKRSGDRDPIAEAAYSAGETLAAIGRVHFEKPGWVAAGPAVTAPLLEGADPTARFVDLCLDSPDLQARLPADLRRQTSELVWSAARELALLDRQTCLVHGDFGRRNLLVRSGRGRWSVCGVLDWEFAVSGSPLIDMGNFLRYERESRPFVEPHFSNGYSDAGGVLPDDWRRLARIVDLAALCEALTHEALPDDAMLEIVDLIRVTVHA